MKPLRITTVHLDPQEEVAAVTVIVAPRYAWALDHMTGCITDPHLSRKIRAGVDPEHALTVKLERQRVWELIAKLRHQTGNEKEHIPGAYNSLLRVEDMIKDPGVEA